MDTPATITRLLRITGRVQGVYYRASTVQQAQALGLRGWVRNRLDGSVEALVTGPADAVQTLIASTAPAMARVDGEGAEVERSELSQSLEELATV